MNVIVIDYMSRLHANEVQETLQELVDAERICLMQRVASRDGTRFWKLLFDGGDDTVATRFEPDGVLCTSLLTADHFDSDSELLVLNSDVENWHTHVNRLLASKHHHFDVFLAFDIDCGLKHPVTSELSLLLQLSEGPYVGLVWFQNTARYFDASQSVIRKDSRLNGEFAFGSLVRELFLNNARVGYQCRQNEPIRTFRDPIAPVAAIPDLLLAESDR